MDYLLALPVFAFLLMLQTAVISRLQLLHGAADIILLVVAAWALQERVRSGWIWAVVAGVLVTAVTALPLFIPLAGYLLVTFLARVLQRRVWKVPILTMFIVAFFGTMGYQFLSLVALKAMGVPLGWLESLTNVIMPSALLNLLFALPVYALVSDLAHSVHASEVDE